MTGSETAALEHCAAGAVLFHNGLWGGPMGFVWRGDDGSPAGHVPQWESEVLMLLERRGLVSIIPGIGNRDARVELTDAGSLRLGVAAA